MHLREPQTCVVIDMVHDSGQKGRLTFVVGVMGQCKGVPVVDILSFIPSGSFVIIEHLPFLHT